MGVFAKRQFPLLSTKIRFSPRVQTQKYTNVFCVRSGRSGPIRDFQQMEGSFAKFPKSRLSLPGRRGEQAKSHPCLNRCGAAKQGGLLITLIADGILVIVFQVSNCPISSFIADLFFMRWSTQQAIDDAW
jgi:hypothetical protein